MDVLNFEFHEGLEYWVTTRDGSRIKVEARKDSGHIDILNDDLDFLVNVTSPEGPINRDFIAGVERIPFEWDQGVIVKRVNADPEFNAGFDRLAKLLSGEPGFKRGMRETVTMEFLENVTLERDCE